MWFRHSRQRPQLHRLQPQRTGRRKRLARLHRLLFKTDDGFRLGRLDTDEACEAAIQVFRQLVREATTGNRRTSDLAYHLIDLQDAAIAPRDGKNTAPWCSSASG